MQSRIQFVLCDVATGYWYMALLPLCSLSQTKRLQVHVLSCISSSNKIVDRDKNANEQEFNFEKARLEVHKFGITGYKKQEQRIWEQERAIMLGAKPPKKQHVNYKTYQEKMKEKKAAKDDDKAEELKADSLKKKKEQKERKAKRKKSVPSIWPAGQVGKFRDGTLILQSHDIKKIKSSKVIK
ncbi:PREDICTED: uncharacterized protein C1orf131 homolog [Apaloderma vittatum]|nr:PREDICTED: uncharacterized protein C1orf131 homolog [Apaloderma vittatum]